MPEQKAENSPCQSADKYQITVDKPYVGVEYVFHRERLKIKVDDFFGSKTRESTFDPNLSAVPHINLKSLFCTSDWLPLKKALLISLIISLIASVSCKTTRRVKEGEFLLVKNEIVVDQKGKVSNSQLQTVLKQKTNRKIFGFIPFHLYMYNLPNPEKVERKMEAKQAKTEARNRKLEAEVNELNKEINTVRGSLNGMPDSRERDKVERQLEKLQNKKNSRESKIKPPKKVFGEWLRTSVGEAPSLLDSSQVNASTRNLNYYLFKKGYFNNEVRDTIVLDTLRKKAKVTYFVTLREPYTINSLEYNIEARGLARRINTLRARSLIKEGAIFDFDVLEKERDRIANELKNNGYHFFSKEYIYFDIDSTIGNQKVNIRMGVKDMVKPDPRHPDSTITTGHQRYFINNVYVYTDYNPRDTLGRYDTLHVVDPNNGDKYIFLYRDELKFKPRVIYESIYIKNTFLYRSREVEATFKKLSSLGIFRSINIQFQINTKDTTGHSLNCFIYLSPSKKQAYSLEANGTNRGGNLGISGNVTYRNKNLFRGAEMFRITMAGGIEAQQVLANENQSIIGDGSFKPLSTFNTVEFGPDFSLSIPKFLVPFNVVKLEKTASPRTIFNANLNYQRRPDFSRVVEDASFAYEWKQGEKINHYFGPLRVSAVKINPDSSFIARLNQINDQFLLNSYRDHFIIGNYYSFTYNGALGTGMQRKRTTTYFKVGLEQAGNLLRKMYEWTGTHRDSVGRVFGIQFAQYLKVDVDFRLHVTFNESSKLAYRLAGGIGLPQRNFNQSLPFEKSFFAGGSNGLRGWRARTLGPGSYRSLTTTFDKIGDIQLEGNVEYRFDLIGFFEGALFVDAGNIWTLRDNPARPGSRFSEEFYKEIAMDVGFGLRFDLSFFLIRLDFALPIRDPSLVDGERWVFSPKTETNRFYEDNGLGPYRARINLNLGIGYPF